MYAICVITYILLFIKCNVQCITECYTYLRMVAELINTYKMAVFFLK